MQNKYTYSPQNTPFRQVSKSQREGALSRPAAASSGEEGRWAAMTRRTGESLKEQFTPQNMKMMSLFTQVINDLSK